MKTTSENSKTETILSTVKNYVGIYEGDTTFDNEILMNINVIISELEIVGTTNTTEIITEETLWDNYIDDVKEVTPLKTLISMKVKLIFDPPGNSFLIESYEKQINKLEWLITAKKEER